MGKVLLLFRMGLSGSTEKENEKLVFVQYMEYKEPFYEVDEALRLFCLGSANMMRKILQFGLSYKTTNWS